MDSGATFQWDGWSGVHVEPLTTSVPAFGRRVFMPSSLQGSKIFNFIISPHGRFILFSFYYLIVEFGLTVRDGNPGLQGVFR